MRYSKRDFFFSVITGLVAGLGAWWILEFLDRPNPGNFRWQWLTIIIPALWVMGVGLGFFLSKWISFMRQFGKFAAIGFTNFVVDIGILNFLIAWGGHAEGAWYAVFKGIAFGVAVTHSFFWNKYWTFEAGESQGGGAEFSKFITVNLVAAGINVGVATFVATGLDPFGGLSQRIWANVAAVVGSAGALVFSFVGLRLLVFKSGKNSS